MTRHDTIRYDTIRGWHQLDISVGNLPQRVQTLLHVATASMFRNPFLWFVMLSSKVIDSRRFVHLQGSLAHVLLLYFCSTRLWTKSGSQVVLNPYNPVELYQGLRLEVRLL